jgi:two-component system, OmpR family, phosphate regulon response regulator PhoB
MPKKILILDDDQDVAALMDVLLRQQGFQTVIAYSSEVFKQLHDINPDIILMDNRLDEGYGKDYCKQLKADPATAHFKIVLVSAAHDLETLAADSCADGFLAKPFDITALTSLVQQLS